MNHAHRIATGLPSTWREVRDSDGTVLYWRREHTGYEVHRWGALFAVEIDGKTLSTHPTLTHAIVACREQMHANSNNGSQTKQVSR